MILGGNARSGFPTSFTDIGGGYINNDIPKALLVLHRNRGDPGVAVARDTIRALPVRPRLESRSDALLGRADARVRVMVFVLSGFMAGVAGIVYLGYFGSVQADAASGSELVSVVTAVVLGGVDIFGGSGSMLGVFLALVLIAVLRDGMQLANIGGAAQDIVVGVLLLGAILAGNVVQAVQSRGLPWGRAHGPGKEVLETELPARIQSRRRHRTTPKVSHEGVE